MNRLKNTIFILFVLLNIKSYAQYVQYDKNYFIFPIKPGQKNYLSGTMGELRNNHFHGGLDIKTDQRTGLAVHASASGYVSRILISSKGYGNALYITHPNGLTTVYGHLEWFNGAIGKYIKEYLYREQCNEIDLYIPKGLLVVNKGDTVARSGNSGSSGGPHLHWEIRDEYERLLNPMFFNFSELDDNVPPIINKLAIRTLDINSRIEGEFGRTEFIPLRNGKDYVMNFPIHAYGLLGIELVAYDKMNGTSNFYGISLLEMSVDGKPLFIHDIQKIAFDENPYINVHIDYETSLAKHSLFQKCYIADGNGLSTYKAAQNNGKLLITDTLIHEVSIKVSDTYRNHTVFNFKIKGTRNQEPKQVLKRKKTPPEIESAEYENILKVDITDVKEPLASLYFNTKKLELDPAYTKGSKRTYLWDMRKSLPDSIKAGYLKHSFHFEEVIPSVNSIAYSQPFIDVLFPKKSVFDTIFLNMTYANQVFKIHKSSVPLFSPVSITLKPDFEVPNKSKSAVFNVYGKNRYRYSGGQWIGNNIRFGTKIFGDFTIKSDSVPPKITFFKSIGKTKYFKLSDNLSGISHWYAYLNGNFLLMHYEPKYNVIYSDMLNENDYVSGDLLIGAIDNLGNHTQAHFKF